MSDIRQVKRQTGGHIVGRLRIERASERGREVVRVAGEIDMATVCELQDALAPLVSVGAPVSIDLADVTFMDSSGLHTLRKFATASANGAGPVWIANPSHTVLRTMEIVGLTEFPQLEIRLTFAKEQGRG